MTQPFISLIDADQLGPAGFQVWFEVLGDFAHHIRTVTGATSDQRMLLSTIDSEPTPYISALMHLLTVADHDQLHAQLAAAGPHATIEHLLRDIADTPGAPARAQLVLDLHAQLADARDALKREWDAL